jgi:hypothetical protein
VLNCQGTFSHIHFYMMTNFTLIYRQLNQGKISKFMHLLMQFAQKLLLELHTCLKNSKMTLFFILKKVLRAVDKNEHLFRVWISREYLCFL